MRKVIIVSHTSDTFARSSLEKALKDEGYLDEGIWMLFDNDKASNYLTSNASRVQEAIVVVLLASENLRKSQLGESTFLQQLRDICEESSTLVVILQQIDDAASLFEGFRIFPKNGPPILRQHADKVQQDFRTIARCIVNTINKAPEDIDVFVSYAREERDFAELVRLHLDQEQLVAWHDERIEAGDRWRGTIDESIRRAKSMVVVVSPSAMNSQYVTYEWAFAHGAGVPVIPVLRTKVELHPCLAELQYIDFSGDERPWSKLAERIRSSSKIAPQT